MNMPRYARYLIAALITFALGVVVATSVRVILPRYAQFKATGCKTRRAADRPKCYGWKEAVSVNQGLGWDLTYLPLLQAGGVCPGHEYCEFAAEKPQPPVHKHFAEWTGEPIVSSILIELPDGHADMTALWLIRTKEQAYWWAFHPQSPDPAGKQPLPTQEYDRAFQTIECWQPNVPQSKTFFDGRNGDGYIGFLNLYNNGKSRQMLLTDRDLFESWPKDAEPDEATWGRVYKTLEPIYSVMREQWKQANDAARKPSHHDGRDGDGIPPATR
jgi:hypothetical protein